ncbi:MAG: ABC transporter permease, partial [Chloroflexia bacterium]|nr:ABC transporter permease [Chloroflexia bacterium]
LAPWTVLFPGLALGLLVLCINMFGDAIRDLLDPRLRTATTP